MRLDKIRVYDTQTVDNLEWVMIGPGEWIEHRFVALVVPNFTRPEGIPADRWIEVNLFEQVLSVYDQGELVFATLIHPVPRPFTPNRVYSRFTKKLKTSI